MKKAILVDIDVISEYLKTGKGVLPLAYEKYKMQVTPVTYAQLLASETFKDEKLEKEVMEFMKKYFEVVSISEKEALEVSRVLRDNDVTLGTAMNAAYAKVADVKVLTGSKKDLDKIDGVGFVEL